MLLRVLKLITAICEGLLSIPFLGGIYIVSHHWTPLLVMFVFHLITFFVSKKKIWNLGSACGMVTSVLGFIPVVGMILHFITAILLLVDLFSPRKNNSI